MFKKIHRELKKESCRKIGNGFLVMALICCLMFVSYQATSAVITSAKVGDRELPIYCVDTTEKKVALSSMLHGEQKIFRVSWMFWINIK